MDADSLVDLSRSVVVNATGTRVGHSVLDIDATPDTAVFSGETAAGPRGRSRDRKVGGAA